MVDKVFVNQGVIIGVVGRDRIEGLIMLLIAQFWYTEDWCLEEIMNFVLPDHRRSTHAKDMIAFAKRCSDEIGIPLVIGVVQRAHQGEDGVVPPPARRSVWWLLPAPSRAPSGAAGLNCVCRGINVSLAARRGDIDPPTYTIQPGRPPGS